jgi:hypothetical protein
MDAKIIVTERLLRQIFDQESKKVVGICMKRFEIHSNPEDQKKAIKEVLYESLRNILDIIILNGKEGISLTNTNVRKE